MMATPLISDSECSEQSHDDHSTDFSDCDFSMLDNAGEVLDKISPAKNKIPAKVRKTSKKVTQTQAESHTKTCSTSKRTKKLTKTEIRKIVEVLKEQKDTIVDKAATAIKKEAFWLAHEEYHECLSISTIY